MSGICAAVKATTRCRALERKTTLKSWKSRPAAPRMIVGTTESLIGHSAAGRSSRRVSAVAFLEPPHLAGCKRHSALALRRGGGHLVFPPGEKPQAEPRDPGEASANPRIMYT